MHLKEGYRLHNGKYQLLNMIGEGGFSLTYKGLWNTEIQGSLGKIPTQAPVCIKEYFFKDYCLRNEKTNFVETNSLNGKIIFDKYKEKIIKEARILSEIHHPNVVKVLEVFKQNNTVYIVMEFISGHSLKQVQENDSVFKEDKLLDIIYKIGQALQYIHEKNILHLDIKPSNILMDINQNPKLIDFGISKRYDLQDQQETSTSILAASKGYASIEQYDSEGMQVFSPCPDIYSLGATMYFLLTGQVPTESILRSTKGLQNPSELNPEISENTERVILKAMELHSNDRYQTVLEMITELGYDQKKDQVFISASLTDKDKDRTELLLSEKEKINQPFDVDDETQLFSKEIKSKGRKKWLLGTLLGLLCIAFWSFLYLNGVIFKDIPSNAVTQIELNDKKRVDSLTVEPQLLEETSSPTLLGSKVEVQKQPQTQEESSTEEPADSSQEQHNEYFNSALLAFNSKDYSAAKKDFEKADSYKNSPNTKKYILLCNKELENQAINNRKEQYEVITEFGTFVVVKRKSDGFFGAIDNKGIERIQCKYLGSDAAGKNRAFIRSDDLFDIYAPSGTTVHEGTDSY